MPTHYNWGEENRRDGLQTFPEIAICEGKKKGKAGRHGHTTGFPSQTAVHFSRHPRHFIPPNRWYRNKKKWRFKSFLCLREKKIPGKARLGYSFFSA
jgi:hypothetical protein